MTFKSMCFKERIDGNIIWADIQLIALPTSDGAVTRVARPVAIEIPKLLPMTAFISHFQQEFAKVKISDEVDWDKIQLMEVQLKPKSNIISLN